MPTDSNTDTQKKAAKDDMARVLNTFFNPVAFDRTIVSPDASPTKKALLHAGGLGIGYGGLAFVLRKLHKLKEAEELGINQELQRRRADAKAYSSGKYPTFTIDPDAADLEEEEALEDRLLGEGQKEASGLLQGVAGTTGRFLDDISSGKHDPAHLALATAAVFAATAGGWRLADYAEDAQRREQLDTSIASTKNKVDKMIHEEYERVKGMGSQKKAADTIHAADIEKQNPSIGDTLTSPTRYPQAVANFWWLWATFAFAFSYKAMKTYSDKQDPARGRMKDLKKLMSSRQKQTGAPVILDASDLPEVPSSSEAGAVKKESIHTAIPTGRAAIAAADKGQSLIPSELGDTASQDLYSELMGA